MIEITIWVISIAVLYFMFRILNILTARAINKLRWWAYHRKQDKTLRDRIF